MTWKDSYDSKGFDEANKEYDVSPLFPYSGRVNKPDGFDVYISGLIRTYDTALQVFGVEAKDVKVVDLNPKEDIAKDIPHADDVIVLNRTPLLNEVPKHSYKDSEGKLPRFWWVMRSRMQWFFNSSRQPENKKMTKARAAEFLDYIEAKNRDCVIFSHEFYLYTLKAELEKRGYIIERSNLFRIKNWERIRATKRDIHCGVCGHNCLLTNPGCDVGRDAARQQGIKIKEQKSSE